MIYLDNAATTFPKPQSVYEAMDHANRTLAFNAGRGSYGKAREATALLDETKQLLRSLVFADTGTPIVFSPSITIALNQVLQGIDWPEKAVVYVSPYEHNAVARTLHALEKQGRVQIRFLPVDGSTLEIDIEQMKYQFIQEKPDSIVCTHISNVTGYILPVAEIFAEGKKYGCLTVLDTAQSLGLVPVDSRILNADIIAFAGHKTLYGPLGIGGFINVGAVPLMSYVTGGTGSDSLNLDMPEGDEAKYEAASSNIVAIAGLNEALRVLDQESNYAHEKEIGDYLIGKLDKLELVKTLLPGNLENHIGVISFVVDGYASDDVGSILDEEYDIAVRTGYHCAPWIHDVIKSKPFNGTVRVGLSRFSSKDEVDALVKALTTI